MAGDTISRQPYLRYRVSTTPGDKYCRFIVTDKATGVREYTYFNTTVVNATAADGILLLGDYDGHAELSFKRLDKEGRFQPNIFMGLMVNIWEQFRRLYRRYSVMMEMMKLICSACVY